VLEPEKALVWNLQYSIDPDSPLARSNSPRRHGAGTSSSSARNSVQYKRPVQTLQQEGKLRFDLMHAPFFGEASLPLGPSDGSVFRGPSCALSSVAPTSRSLARVKGISYGVLMRPDSKKQIEARREAVPYRPHFRRDHFFAYVQIRFSPPSLEGARKIKPAVGVSGSSL